MLFIRRISWGGGVGGARPRVFKGAPKKERGKKEGKKEEQEEEKKEKERKKKIKRGGRKTK